MKNISSSSKYKVGLDVKDLDEGMEYILTTKDKNVLDDDNDDLVELENTLLKQAKRNKKNVNIKFIQNESNPFEKEEMLAQYSEAKEECFIIDEENKDEELNKIKDRLKLLKDNKSNLVELSYKKTFATDYMTQDEFQKTEFKKFKKNNKKINRTENAMDKEDAEKISKVIDKAKENIDEYDELDKLLETQRNIVIQEKKRKQEQKLKEIVENKNKHEENFKGNNIYNNIDKEYISETVEFLKNVPTKQEIDENYKLMYNYIYPRTTKTPVTLRDVKSGTASIVHMPLPTERLRYGMSSVTREYSEPIINNIDTPLLSKKRQRDDSITTEALSETEVNHQEALPLEEPYLGKGIGVALEVFRKRNMIGKERYYGRNKDKVPTYNNPTSNNPTSTKKEVNLEYRDEKGRLMTQKESYRYLCHIFHRNAPSKRKQEKRILKEEQEQRNANMDVSMNTRTLKYLKRQQETTNLPYVVLQGKNNINNI